MHEEGISSYLKTQIYIPVRSGGSSRYALGRPPQRHEHQKRINNPKISVQNFTNSSNKQPFQKKEIEECYRPKTAGFAGKRIRDALISSKLALPQDLYVDHDSMQIKSARDYHSAEKACKNCSNDQDNNFSGVNTDKRPNSASCIKVNGKATVKSVNGLNASAHPPIVKHNRIENLYRDVMIKDSSKFKNKTSNQTNSEVNHRQKAIYSNNSRLKFTQEEVDSSIESMISLLGNNSACDLDERNFLLTILIKRNFQCKSTLDFYALGKVVGVGSFAKVRIAIHKLTCQKIAIKTYERSKAKDLSQWKRVQIEIKVMQKLNHPYIVRMFEAIETPKRIHIVMEHTSGGNLCSYIKKRRMLPEQEARSIIIQVIFAINYMHKMHIIHRDIKLENILIDSSNNIKLIDFGFSVCSKNKPLKTFCGTPSYMAPEIIKRTQYAGKPVDVWSIGILLFAILCGRFPFAAKNYNDLYKKILTCKYEIPDKISSEGQDLLRRMITPDPFKRITLDEVLSHPWITIKSRDCKDGSQWSPMKSHLVPKGLAKNIVVKLSDKLETLGIPKQIVYDAITSDYHNAITAIYYLSLLHAETIRRNNRMSSMNGNAEISHLYQSKRPMVCSKKREGPEIASMNNMTGILEILDTMN